MLNAWPWLAVVLAAVACGLRDRRKEDAEGAGGFDWVCFAPFVLALGLAAMPWPWKEGPLFARGMVTGAFVGGLAAWLMPGPVGTAGRFAAVLGLAVAGAAPAHLLDVNQLPQAAHLQLGVAAGAGLAAIFAQRRSRTVGGSGAVALATVGVLAADALGRFRLEKMLDAEAGASASMTLPSVGIVLGIAWTAAALVGGVAGRWSGERVAWSVSAVLGWMLGAVALSRYLGLGSLVGVYTLAVVVGLLAVWLTVGSEERASWPALLGVVLTLGLAGAAFSMGRGLGMAIAVAACSAVLVALPRTAPILGPLVALVLIRVLREQTESLRAIDVLHNQTAMGLVLGAALVLLAREAPFRGSSSGRRLATGVGWWLVAGATVALAGFVFGPRATLALLLGAGFGLCVPGAAGDAGQRAAGTAVALMAFSAAGMGWVVKVFEEFSRDQRVLGLVASLVALAIGAAAIALGAWVRERETGEVQR